MNHTNTDYLFQAVVLGLDRASIKTSAGVPEFGGHLSQAATTVFDTLRPEPSPAATPESTPGSNASTRESEDSLRESQDSTSSANSSEGSDPPDYVPPPTADESSNPQSPQCDQARGAAAVPEEGEERDTAGDSEDGEAGSGAIEAAAGAATSKTAMSDPKDDRGSAAAAAVETVAVDAKLQDGADRHKAATKISPQPANGSPTDVDETSNSITQDAHATELDLSAPTKSRKNAAVVKHRNAASSDSPAATSQSADEQQTANQSVLHGFDGTASSAAVRTAEDNTADGVSRRRTKLTERAPASSGGTNAPAPKAESPAAHAAPPSQVPTVVAPVMPAERMVSPPRPAATKGDSGIGPLHNAMESATAISRGGRRKETPEAPQVDAARFIGRVAKAFHTAQERGGTLQLRLSPPELGALKLQLTVKDGVLSATLETERPDTRQLLLEHLPALRDRLAEQNIRVERFDVDVGQDQHRGQADPRNDNPHSEQGRTERAVKQRAATGNGRKDSAPAREQTAPAPRIGNTNINLVI